MSNTINIVQPKAEDGVTDVSYVTRTNSIFKSDGSPLGDSMDAYMDEVDELSQNLAEIGTIVSDSDTVSVPANTFTNIITVTLSKGVWVVTSFINLSQSITGIYVHRLVGSSTTIAQIRNNGQNGGGTSLAAVVNVNTSLPVTLSGHIPTAVNMTGTITAVRIK